MMWKNKTFPKLRMDTMRPAMAKTCGLSESSSSFYCRIRQAPTGWNVSLAEVIWKKRVTGIQNVTGFVTLFL